MLDYDTICGEYQEVKGRNENLVKCDRPIFHSNLDQLSQQRKLSLSEPVRGAENLRK